MPYLLSLTASPDTLPADGSTPSTLTAALTTRDGVPAPAKEIEWEIVAGDGLIDSFSVNTDLDGEATAQYIAGLTSGVVTVQASHGGFGATVVAQAEITLETPLADLAVFVLDITLHDPVTGDPFSPGEVEPFEPVEVRANIRNIGGLATPGDVTVEFSGSLVDMAAGSITDLGVLGSVTTASLDPGNSTVASIETAFTDEGFHLITVVVDPDPAPLGVVKEASEDNNRATQGFWIGEAELEADEIIQVTADIRSPTGLSSACGGRVVPATRPGATLWVYGRADYIPFIPFDPDRSQGISAVKGGRVRLEMTDSIGNPVAMPPLMPVEGDTGQFRALHTVGTFPGLDKTPVGQYPNRSANDTWSFPVPQATGCYILTVSVTDMSFTGSISVPFAVKALPDLAVRALTLPPDPGDPDEELPPQAGVPTTISTQIVNVGDQAEEDVRVVFVEYVGEPPVATELASLVLPTVGPGEVIPRDFPWEPKFSTDAVEVQVDPDNTVEEWDETNNLRKRLAPDINLSGIDIWPISNFQGNVSFSITNAGEMPIGTYDYDGTITKPDGSVVNFNGTGNGTTITPLPFLFDSTGTYTMEVSLDTPIDLLLDTSGVIPERIEVANNMLTEVFTLYTDPSPWKHSSGPNGPTADIATEAITLATTPPITLSDAVQYDRPIEVTVLVVNHGNTTLPAGVEVLLTSEQGAILETDADASGDIKQTTGYIDHGQSETVTFTWTPRYGDPEVRELRAVVDPNNALTGLDDMREDNNQTDRQLYMDLSPEFGAVAAPRFGEQLLIPVELFNYRPSPPPSIPRLMVIPNEDSSDEPQSIVRLTGERADGTQVSSTDLRIPWNAEIHMTVTVDPSGASNPFGKIPEGNEQNNTTTETFSMFTDPSPWKDPRGENYIEIVGGVVVRVNIDITTGAITVPADTSSPSAPAVTVSNAVQYNEPVEVIVQVFNYGTTTLGPGVEVLLTSPQGAILETDADADGDIKETLGNIDPGQSETVTFTWTPRLSSATRCRWWQQSSIAGRTLGHFCLR
jgi:hypothetical protein